MKQVGELQFFLRICNLKIKSQRLHGGNETNYENSKNRTFSRDDIKSITRKIPPVEEKIRQSSILLYKSSVLIG